jgi:hypothetical protein
MSDAQASRPDVSDEGDSGADATPEHSDDAPSLITMPCLARRPGRDGPLEYRKRVELEYVAYNAKDAQPEDAPEISHRR